MKALVAVLALFCVMAVGCRHHHEEDVRPVVAVKVIRAQVANVPLTVEAPATIFGKAQANISSRLTAPILSLRLHKGDEVKAGQLLAVLDSRDLEAQQAEASAALADAEASFQKTKNGTLPTDFQSARSELEAKEAALTLAQKIYERRSDLYLQGAISARELQTSEADRAQAKANYDVARLNLDVLEHQTSANDLEIARSRVEEAQARHALAQADLSFAELRSPMKGTITEQFMYQGDMAKPELPLFTVVDLSDAVAHVEVPESQAAQIARQQTCTFAVPDSSIAALAGKITVVNQAVDPARRTIEVWCQIPNPKRLLKAGIFGKVTIFIGMAVDALVVPQAAVEFQEGSSDGHVYVVDQQKIAHRRDVEGVPINSARVRITRGIAPGEMVIIEGAYRTLPGTSLEESNRILNHVEQFLRETPEVESYSRRTGARLALAIAEPNTGDFLIKLRKKRSRSLEDVTSELRRKINHSEPAIQVEFPHILEDLVGDLAWSPQPIEIKIYSDDERVYQSVAKSVEAWLPRVKGVVDIENQNVPIGPSMNFRIDPVRAGQAGFDVKDIADLEATILDGRLASNMILGDRLIGLRVRYPTEDRASFAALESQLITSPSGQTVPLSSIADGEVEEGQTEIRRENLRNLAVVTAHLEGRDLGSAMEEIRARLPKEIRIPPGVEIEYGGLYQIQQESFAGLTRVLLMSMLLIFIILVFEFRSFSHPIAILIVTVLCGSGTLLALYITNTTLNISSFMGAIMVIGIVHKNGILMLDAERHFTSMGHPLQQAIFLAGNRRLRPILMTALATIFGMLPLAIGVGSGAQLLQPLAIAVIGGVAVSMLLSLLITPSLFYLLRSRGW